MWGPFMNPLIAQARKVEGFEDTPRWYMIWRFHDNWLLITRAECIICSGRDEPGRANYIAEVVHDRYHLDMPHEVKISFFKQVAEHGKIHSQDVDAPTPGEPSGLVGDSPNGSSGPLKPAADDSHVPASSSSERGQLGAGERSEIVSENTVRLTDAGRPPIDLPETPPAKSYPSSASLDTTATVHGDPAPSEPCAATGAKETTKRGPPCLICGTPSYWLAASGVWAHCGRRVDDEHA